MSLSLQARLSNPISRCSTIGTESARSVTQMSGEVSEDEPIQVLREKGISEPKETRETMMTMNGMKRYTNGRGLIPTNSRGRRQTKRKAEHCETSVLPPETSSPTTPSMSNSPKHISLTRDRHQSSPIRNGDRSCWDSPSTSTLFSVDDTPQS